MEQAASLVAEDYLTDAKIAEEVGIDRRTLARWKGLKRFDEKVAKFAAEYLARARETGIARVECRVAAQNRRWRALQNIVKARGVDLAGECPGGEEGLQVRQIKFAKVFTPDKKTNDGLEKLLRSGADEVEIAEEMEDADVANFIATKVTVPVYEYVLDKGLMEELRALETQTAKELGQWTEKSDVTTGGQPLGVIGFKVNPPAPAPPPAAEADPEAVTAAASAGAGGNGE